MFHYEGKWQNRNVVKCPRAVQILSRSCTHMTGLWPRRFSFAPLFWIPPGPRKRVGGGSGGPLPIGSMPGYWVVGHHDYVPFGYNSRLYPSLSNPYFYPFFLPFFPPGYLSAIFSNPSAAVHLLHGDAYWLGNCKHFRSLLRSRSIEFSSSVWNRFRLRAGVDVPAERQLRFPENNSIFYLFW